MRDLIQSYVSPPACLAWICLAPIDRGGAVLSGLAAFCAIDALLTITNHRALPDDADFSVAGFAVFTLAWIAVYA